jgi:hypothetical protein
MLTRAINVVMRSTARCREVYERVRVLRDSDWEVARMAVRLAQKRARQLSSAELMALAELEVGDAVATKRFDRLEALGLAVTGSVYLAGKSTRVARMTPLGRVVLDMARSGEVRRE